MPEAPDPQRGSPASATAQPARRSAEEICERIVASPPAEQAELQAEIQRALPDAFERNAALLLCDVVGHAAFAEPNGRRIIERHHSRISPVIDGFGGRVLKLGGDAILVVFPTAAKAVDAAIAMQQAAAETESRATLEGDRVQLRISAHFGPILATAPGGEVLVDTVATLGRVHGTSAPRQILVSDAVRAQLPTTMPLARLGEVTSKRGMLSVHQIAWAELGRPDDALPRLDPRYRVVSKLGMGGMATVWRARDDRLGRDVAIKVLHRNLPFSASMRERLQREARVAAGLSHENIVQVYDVAVPETGDSYIAMELVEGRSLRDHVEKLKALPAFAAALAAYEIARGLGYAHARGVVHRDVKPDNVLVSERGAVKVGDFGIALMDELVRLTASGVPVGTPAYLSPEQVRGERADTRSDVFAFGVLLYEICTGKLPFNGASASAVMYKIVEGSYPSPETQGVVEPALAAVIKRCLKADPADRFQNAEQIVEALRPLLQSWSVVDPRATLASYVTEGNLKQGRAEAAADGVPTVATPPLKRRRRRWAAIGGAAALLIAATAVTVAVTRGDPVTPATDRAAATGASTSAAADPNGPAATTGAATSGAATTAATASAPTGAAATGAGTTAATASGPTGAAATGAGTTAATASGPTGAAATGAGTTAATASGPTGAAATGAGSTAATAAGPTGAAATGAGTTASTSAAASTSIGPGPGGVVTTNEAPVIAKLAPKTPPRKKALPDGALHVVPVGAWADVVIDGKLRGRSPPLTRLELPPGQHQVELRNPHRSPYRTTIRIVSGQEQTLRAELPALP